MPKRLMAYLFTATCLVQLAGCSSPGDTVVENQQQGTYGQQLLDLKKAYDEGVISKGEYEDSRESILDKMND